MKKTTCITAFLSIAFAGAMLLPQLASTQVIPDTIFDNPPRAFGNTVQDVTPDILAVEISPAAPRAGGDVRVSANIWVNPEISKFKVKEAYVYYREANQITDMKRVSMTKDDGRPDWWVAMLPGFADGATVEYFVRGVDEIDNEVIQLPTIADPKPEQMLDIAIDGRDDDLPGTMDILNMSMAYNGTELIACPKMRLRFQQYSTLGANAIAMGFIADDVRMHPSRSVTENTAGFVGYVPALDIEGILKVEDLQRGVGKRGGAATARVFGQHVCLRAKLSSLTPTPERGMKIFGATLGISPLNQEIYLGDATPYSMVYFKGGVFTVGPKLP
ncbi:MAG: hypothetical protein WCX65_02950 [bacterium]